MAWKAYDVAVYYARWYSVLAQVFQFLTLVLSVVIIVFTVLYTQRCNEGEDANIDDCLKMSMSENATEGIIFSFSVAMSFVLSLDAYLIPFSRALHLKSGAAELESIIWLYRAPAGIRWCRPSLVGGLRVTPKQFPLCLASHSRDTS